MVGAALRGGWRWSGRGLRTAVALAVWAACPPAWAQDASDAKPGEVLVPVERPAGPGDAAPPREVDLDDLLRLPSGYGAEVERRGGATASEWRARFGSARQEIEDARKKLAELDAELDKASGSASAWQVSAPGSSDPQASPLSLRLRQDIKAERARIEEGERQLRALEVQADLAAVPPAWRE